MRQATYRGIREILRHKIYQPPAQNSRELTTHTQSRQLHLYKELHDLLRRAGDATLTSVQDRARGFLDSYVDRQVPAANSNIGQVSAGAYILTSQFPVLTSTSMDEAKQLIETNRGSSDILIVCFAAGLLFESRAVIEQDQPPPVPVLSEISSYAAWRMLEDALDTKEGALAKHEQDVRESVKSFGEEASRVMDETRQKFAAATSAAEQAVAALSEQVNQASEAARLANEVAANFESRGHELTAGLDAKFADMEDKYGKAEADARAFMDAVRVEANFEDLKIHWVDRGKSARLALVSSWGALLVLLVGIPAIAVWCSTTIVDFLERLTNAATVDVGPNPGAVAITVATISRLVVITVPLALYFRLIRLVVRFNMRSMLLMDDARQRATMLETYYRMIEKSAATVEDRALVLQALMRPAPGHGPDSVEPPDFTEVINKAMGK